MKKLISLVVPAYQERACISLFYNKLVDTLEGLTEYDFEIIFVDDGSTDGTWEIINTLSHETIYIKALHLSRNFGKEIAMTAGIDVATWDAVITLDADGQHPVEKILDFLQTREQWYDIVYNKRPNIQWSTWMKRFTSTLFYSFFNKISDFKLEPGTTDYRLMDRKVVDYFLKFREKNRLYRGLVDWMWFSKQALIFDAGPRLAGGQASYSYKKLRRLAMDSITSFSLFPLKLVWYFGIVVVAISMILICVMLYDIFFQDNSLNFNNTSFLVIFSIFLSGITLASLGMIALYIANIHEEVMERPLYIIKDKIGIDG